MAAPFRTAAGSVTSFDDLVGTGMVGAADGSEWPFHCTAMADGTRTIDPGTVVTFRLVAGHHGRWEATDLVSVGNRTQR